MTLPRHPEGMPLPLHPSGRPIRVLHLCGGRAAAGAGRGAAWLHEAMLAQGLESRLIFAADQVEAMMMGQTRDGGPFGRLAGVIERGKVAANRRLGNLANRRDAPTRVEVPLLRRNVLRSREAFDWADVIHLQWIGDASFDVDVCRNFGKPVIMTLRDMSAFTGGCAYDMGCGGFRNTCSPCPALSRPLAGWLASWQLERRTVPQEGAPFRVAAISRWLAEMAAESPVLRHYRVDMIPNAVDTAAFAPTAGRDLRSELGMPSDEILVLSGCLELDSDYKNMGLIVDLVRHMEGQKVRFALFGAGGNALRAALPPDAPVHFLGLIRNDAELAQLYSAADVFAITSVQEAFGKTVVEAALCETPVVAYAGTGAADAVADGETGYLAREQDSADFASGIAQAHAANHDGGMGRSARQFALANFSASAIARKYTAVYRELIDADQGKINQ